LKSLYKFDLIQISGKDKNENNKMKDIINLPKKIINESIKNDGDLKISKLSPTRLYFEFFFILSRCWKSKKRIPHFEKTVRKNIAE
jgi:hypothetical protein